MQNAENEAITRIDPWNTENKNITKSKKTELFES